MENLLQDVRYAGRVLRKSPGFASVAIITLAIGIGANTAIFSVVDGVLLRPLPYADPDQLVMVWQDHTRIDGPIDEWASPNNFFDWRDQNDVFSGVFALGGFGGTLTGLDEPEMLQGAAASYDAFDVLGVEPLIGRNFLPEEDTASSAPVVILGYSLWQRRFDGDQEVLGSTITLNGAPAMVVGVMPEGFSMPIVAGNDIFAPLGLDATNACGRGCVTLRTIARIDDGVTLDHARANMDALAASLEREYPDANNGVGVYLEPLHDRIVGPVRAGLWMLLGAVGFVLLIACANVANLMLARATGRRVEIAIRVAIGAGRARLLRQMLTESLMLAIAGGAFGLLLALWGVDLLLTLLPTGTPRFDQVGVDATALAFTLLASAATGLAFGLVPALRASNPRGEASLKDGGTGAGTGASGMRLRGALVVAEVALAVMLLIGGGLLLRSFTTLMDVDPGFDADNLLTQQLFLPPTSYAGNPQLNSFVGELVDRVEALPGVVGAAVIDTMPLGAGNQDRGFLIEGQPRPQQGQRPPVAWYRDVTPGYFETMKMRLVSGRWFEDRDRQDAPLVVLLNEAAVRRYWGDDDAVGGRITLGGDVWREVVGVVADTKHFGLDQDERPAMYLPYGQLPSRFMNLVVRTAGDPTQLSRSVQSEVWQIDANLAVSGTATMREIVSGSVAIPRLIMALLVTFAASAMVLAAIGIYGVMSYSVGQRIREIGVRIALGAYPGDVLRLVVGRGMLLLFIGTAAGMLASLALSRFMESLLFGVGATDPLTFVLVPAALTVIAFVACWVPARRAARVDPIVALRAD